MTDWGAIRRQMQADIAKHRNDPRYTVNLLIAKFGSLTDMLPDDPTQALAALGQYFKIGQEITEDAK